MEEPIYVKGFIENLQPLTKGRSITFPEGWIYISDIEKLLKEYEKGDINRFGKKIY